MGVDRVGKMPTVRGEEGKSGPPSPRVSTQERVRLTTRSEEPLDTMKIVAVLVFS